MVGLGGTLVACLPGSEGFRIEREIEMEWTKAKQDGYEAQFDGVGFDECPYRNNLSARAEWEAGWKESEAHEKVMIETHLTSDSLHPEGL